MMRCLSVLILLLAPITFSQSQSNLPIPTDCKQMILVLTDSITATKGTLVRFERSGEKNKWQQIEKMIPVVLGRNGLGWGKSLNGIDSAILPIKTEGDGRSPAGVFKLGAAFGYAGADKMKDLKIPYIPVSEMVECIDDIKSNYYNQIIIRDKIKEVDWNSSEKMYFADIWYEQGIVVEQNTSPVVNGSGSCIFIHNWSKPDETSAGCTELEPARLTEIINWLDASANPVLVQLTKGLYELYQKTWQLPFPE
ncbi:MAG TPA: hypothetical protein DHV28_06695 [Ignavibacteriales bacterium]|nr:hypothetical protein [Ignavibacteriales bacterium]